jgi:hypothetical protein
VQQKESPKLVSSHEPVVLSLRERLLAQNKNLDLVDEKPIKVDESFKKQVERAKEKLDKSLATLSEKQDAVHDEASEDEQIVRKKPARRIEESD